MKKILSISNLFVKRIGLVAILLATIGVGDVWAYAKSTVKATANPSSGAGTAQVSKSSTSGFAASATLTTGGRLNTNGNPHTYYLKASTTSAAWLWKGWYNNGVLAVQEQTSSIQVNGKFVVMGSAAGNEFTYTATWLQPKVTGTTAGEDGGTNIKNYVFGPYTDPNVGSETRDVVFTLESNESGLIAKDGTVPTQHFTEALSGSWTANTFVKNSSDFPGIDQSSYTYNVTYKLSGVHGTNVTAKIKVASKYGSTNCTAQLMATEDYMPYFNYAYTEYNYTPDDPLAEGESLAQTFNVSKNCYAANNGVWSISLPADAAAKGFTLQTAAENPNATVQFEALPGMNKADLTTTLTATCTYTDASGAKVTYTQTILLSGDAGKVITIDGAEVNTMTFDIDYAASGESTQTLPFETTLTGLTTTPSNLPAGDFITYTTWVAGLTDVSVTVKHNLTPGQYTPSIKYSYNSDEVYSILNIVANIRLAKPVVTATNGLGQQLHLSWQSVLGATSYIVEGKRAVDAEFAQLIIIGDDETIATSYVVNNIGGVVLTTGTEYTFRVTAVYGPDEFANRLSDEVSATPSAQGSITASSSVELYTGTEIFLDNPNDTYGKFPYSKKRAINLDATFSPSGVPLFDKLYIFGMTTSEVITTVSGQTGHKITPASNTKGSDAITPCYVYVKNGNQYDLQQTIPNMNVTNKPIADISGATSVYLTGYCPYASTGGGNNKNENGVICFIGGAGVQVDVYVDDLELFARYKSSTGKTTKPDTVLYSNFSTTYRCTGTSSALTFKGTSSNSGNPFQPTIHMRDSNRLAGNVGSAVRVKIEMLGMSMDQTAGQYNSPIGLLTDDDKRYTTLSIDDVWPASMADNATANVRTNGFLDIRTTTAAPCIDLYDQYGKVNFNGGRIYLKNSRPSGSNNYLCTFAVGYRKYEKSISIATATMYGLGTDQSGGEVHFNDGSFYIDSLTNAEFTNHAEYYHHKFALKCPSSSTINGGTYYCEPFACDSAKHKGGSPLNKYGDGLVLDTVAVDHLLEPYKTAVITFPNDKEVQEEYAATYPATLGDYYAAKGATYGISSLNAYQGTQAPDSVILMLPVQYTDKELQKNVANIAWALCIPEVVAGGGAASVSMGGDIEVVDREEENAIYQTNYLLYGAIDGNLQALVNDGRYQTPEFDGLPSADVELTGGTYSDIINEEAYTIQQEQYMLMNVEADEWFLFAPPFDISEVYVLETYKEDELATMAKNTSWQDAINLQADANMDLFYVLCYTIGYKQSDNDFNRVFSEWSKPSGAGGKIKLTHFTGANYSANYYVQRSSGTWGWDSEKSRFVTDWAYLPATMEKVTHGDTEYSVVMKKGEIYSLKFPYMYYGYREEGDGNGNNNWDYWTGKYILFVGKGPQTIEGTNYHQTITNSTMTVPSGSAEIRANSTFASMEVSGMRAYYLGENQRFTPSIDDSEFAPIDATQGFVLLNKSTISPLPQRIASIDMMTGDVTYEPGDGSENTVTGTPTIAGEREMLVYTVAGGLGVVPVVPQHVSIYNAAGQLVVSQYLTDDTQFALPTGIYLIRGEKDQAKAMVK